MEATEFKENIKKVMAVNPKPIKLTIAFASNEKPKEVFTKKTDFGFRLLEIFEEEGFNSIDLRMCKEKGYIGNLVGLQTLVKQLSMIGEISELEFMVWYDSDIKRQEEAIAKMPIEEFMSKNQKY